MPESTVRVGVSLQGLDSTSAGADATTGLTLVLERLEHAPPGLDQGTGTVVCEHWRVLPGSTYQATIKPLWTYWSWAVQKHNTSCV